ncbi:hypothetical protein R9X49_06445 [Pectobacterium carotovorum]|uniref:hypothetical protein n=1 Tax=Pectobacterium carotovorum TaxID=554 RepID=UPI0029DCC3F4|nr:hypothetical protein [Pectobacterium carotovorum]MDX6914745.1 hypothetical protein [Pectobacterium carotovorum]
MEAIEVKRDEYGFWTHPDYFEPANGMDYGYPGEFDAWLSKNNLESYTLSLEDDIDASDFAERYADGEFDADVSGWNPSKPKGDGWFIGSLHDTEDGPYCIWLRKKQQAA